MSSDWPELVQQRVRALSKTCPLKKLNSSFLKSSNKDVKGSAYSIFSNRHSKRRMMPAPSMARGKEELPIHHHHHHGLPPDLPRSNQNAYLHLQRKSRETKGFNYEEEAKRVDTDTELEKRLIHSSCSCRGEPQTKRTRRRRQQDCVPKKANLIRHHISLPFSVVATSSNAVHDYNEVVNQKDQGGSKVMKQSTNSNEISINNVVTRRKKIRKENRGMYESFLEYRFHLIRANADKQRHALRTADVNRREQRQEYCKVRSATHGWDHTRDDIDLEKRKLKMMENWLVHVA